MLTARTESVDCEVLSTGSVLIAEVEVEQWIREVRLKADVDGARALEVALGMAAVDMFVQLPCLLGRQFTHGLLAFTQAQLLHTPALLHLQHTISRPSGPSANCNCAHRRHTIYKLDLAKFPTCGCRKMFVCILVE